MKYDYICKECDTIFEVERPMADREVPIACPECEAMTNKRYYGNQTTMYFRIASDQEIAMRRTGRSNDYVEKTKYIHNARAERKKDSNSSPAEIQSNELWMTNSTASSKLAKDLGLSGPTVKRNSGVPKK